MRRLSRRRVLLGAMLLLSGCVAPGEIPAPAPAIRILFVGNSQLYVGNLPAVFDAMALANGRQSRSDMLVKGGATLSERAKDGSVAAALERGRYDVVVLQERGGDLLGAFGPEASAEADAALRALVPIVRAHGARPVLLGTYQALPGPSAALVQVEREAAQRAGIPYIAVSGHLQTGLSTALDRRWFAADRAHPGPDLVLLDAVLLHAHVFDRTPAPRGFAVEAPIYTAKARFFPPQLAGERAEPEATTPPGIVYLDSDLRAVLRILALPAR